MILKYGICGICDKTLIGDYTKGNFIGNDNYTEIEMRLSDRSIAKHGICKNCRGNLNSVLIAWLFDRIKETWIDETIQRGGSQEYIEYVKKLKVVSYIDKKQVIIKNAI